MKSIRCTADLACVLDGVLEPCLRTLLADHGLSLGSHIVVVHPRDTLDELTSELGAPLMAHLLKGQAERKLEVARFVLGVTRREGGWLEAKFATGTTAFVPDRIDVAPELLIPLLTH